jgi:outer membrane protein OmpA-like peptidoglycan-associated protein
LTSGGQVKARSLQWSLLSLLAAALIGSAGPLWALSTTMGPYGLGASALGAGGAAVSTAEGAEGLYWNPASMSDGLNLGYFGGLGGPLQSQQEAVAITGPVDQGVSGGLLLGDQLFPQAGNYHEDNVDLALATAVGNWFSIGTVQKFELASPGALTGWSMDVGALAAVPLGGTWRLDLGLAGTDLLSSLSWGDGLTEEQPSVLRAGAAIEPLPGTWAAFEEDQLESLGEPGVDQWRAGLQISLFDRRAALRAGATQAQQGVLYYTAGLGVRLPSADRGLELDYAVLIPNADSAGGERRQVVSLLWHFGAARSPEATIQLERRGRDGQVEEARIALAEGPTDALDWSLELTDPSGKIVRTIKGHGLLPPGVDWDGKDEAGEPVDADGLSYVLRVTRASGEVVQSRALLAPSADQGWEGALAGSEGDEYSLRGGGPVARSGRGHGPGALRAGVTRDFATGGLLYTFYFEWNGTALTGSDLQTLAHAAALIRARGLKAAVIDGYADQDEGDRDNTDPLSQARADTVLKGLMERGVVLDRVMARGWADTRPAAPEDTARERARNRRVELRLEAAP